MSDIKLFSTTDEEAKEIIGSSVALEKSLQTLMERNLEVMLGVRFLASEYSTGKKHRGRIDTLGIDENNSPVIIEYKRTTTENVINQGLFYLDWLLDHQAEFKLLVMEVLGHNAGELIDWSAPRLLCIAGDFTRYDEHAVDQMNRQIELIRYRRFGEDFLLLEQVNTPPEGLSQGAARDSVTSGKAYKTISEVLDTLSGPLANLYEDLKNQLTSLGDDVQVKTLKFYVAFRRLKNFACVDVHPNKGSLTVFVKVDPDSIELEDGFTRDVRSVGHFGTGGLEITIRNQDDLRRSSDLLLQSYENS